MADSAGVRCRSTAFVQIHAGYQRMSAYVKIHRESMIERGVRTEFPNRCMVEKYGPKSHLIHATDCGSRKPLYSIENNVNESNGDSFTGVV